MDPGDREIADIAGVDLGERTVVVGLVGTIFGQPVILATGPMRAVSTDCADAEAENAVAMATEASEARQLVRFFMGTSSVFTVVIGRLLLVAMPGRQRPIA